MIAFIILLNCILKHEDIATCNFYFSVSDYNICTLPLQTISCQVRLCTTTSVNSLIAVVQFTRKFFLTTEHWVQIYPSQKKINYISPSSIRASVENSPFKLHNLLQFSPPSHTWHFIGLPRASRGFAIHVFLVYYILSINWEQSLRFTRFNKMIQFPLY